MDHPSFFPLRPRVRPGRLLIMPGVIACLQRNEIPSMALLLRHICGDWGDVSADDWRQNDLSVASGLRVLSIYTMPDSTKVWVITEWNRSVTTVLLPDDY